MTEHPDIKKKKVVSKEPDGKKKKWFHESERKRVSNFWSRLAWSGGEQASQTPRPHAEVFLDRQPSAEQTQQGPAQEHWMKFSAWLLGPPEEMAWRSLLTLTSDSSPKSRLSPTHFFLRLSSRALTRSLLQASIAQQTAAELIGLNSKILG